MTEPAALSDPVDAFILAACVPRHSSHSSGTLKDAEMILERYPEIAAANVYAAAILADEEGVRAFIQRDRHSATAKGGPHGWDALSYLCFSRYLRLDRARSEAFVCTARCLLDAGASANTAWIEMIDHPNPAPIVESALYGAAAIARHPELTRLLLEYGADPNDGETAYHVPEGYDNTVMKILLDSRRFNQASLACLLARKADWHDQAGLRLVLEHGGDPNFQRELGGSALHHALRRGNALSTIEILLDYDADPILKSNRDGLSASVLAARRGRADVLGLLEQRGFPLDFQGVDQLIAACAQGKREAIQAIVAREPDLIAELIAMGGTLLSEFAGSGNYEGVRCLLDLGVSASARYEEGDMYLDVTKDSTALHMAAWRAYPAIVKELIDRGAAVNAVDLKGRSALALAVKACVDSYWTERRSPESVAALLKAGASVAGVQILCGYEEVDKLLRQA